MLTSCRMQGKEEKKVKVPLTQKARGVVAMKLWRPWSVHVPNFYLVQDTNDVAALRIFDHWYSTLWFGRFCPPVPEHGYIDSKVVRSKTELLAMLAETKARHEKSEIMIMPYATSLIGSFVWTPSLVTVGEGNDGATAGKNGCIRVPLVPTKVPQEVLDAAGVPEEASPYIEGLASGFEGCPEPDPLLVQLRHGPQPPAALDFVPHSMVVKRVVKADGALLDFQELVKTLEEGTVVDHFGGSLTSHYGVHCLLNNVPVVTTHTPVIGEAITRVGNTLPEWDPKAIVDWALYALRDAMSRRWTNNEMAQMCNASLFILHNAAAMGGRPELVGTALAVLMKLCTAACYGEARHAPGDDHHGKARQTVFREMMKRSLPAICELDRKRESFESVGTLSVNVGGQAWAQCTTVTIDLIEAIKDMVEEPTKEKVAAALSAANVAVNEAHNGGWWLNKFTTDNVFDACSKGEPWAVAYAIGGLRAIEAQRKVVKPQTFKRVVNKKKVDLLAARRMERRPVLLRDGRHSVWFLSPVSGELFTMGCRIGYKMDALNSMVQDVRSGKIAPMFQSEASLGEIIRNGAEIVLKSYGYFLCSPIVQMRYTLVVRGLQMISLEESGYPSFHMGVSYLETLANRLKAVELERMLCVKCYRAAAVPRGQMTEDVKCAECGGEYTTPDPGLCEECGEFPAVAVSTAGKMLCMSCLWKGMVAQCDLHRLQEKQAKEERAQYVTIPRIMCSHPECSIVEYSSGRSKAWRCDAHRGPHGDGELAMTLERMKELS